MSPDSGRGRRTREGQGLGAQGGLAAGTAVRPRSFLRPPRAAWRGRGSRASGARSHSVRRRGLVWESGAKGSGVSPRCRAGGRDRLRVPELPPAPPPPTESLGRAWTEADVVGSDFPAAAPRPLLWGGGLSWKAKLPTRAWPPSPWRERPPCSRGSAVRAPPLAVGEGGVRTSWAPRSSCPHRTGCPCFPALGRVGGGGIAVLADSPSAPRGPARA